MYHVKSILIFGKWRVLCLQFGYFQVDSLIELYAADVSSSTHSFFK